MKILKWIGMAIGAIIVLLVILAGVLHFMGQSRLNTAPEVTVVAVAASTDEDAVGRGEHLATISSCGECHGGQLKGDVFIGEAPIGYVPAPNLTSGVGGIGATYTDEDWARAIRHGVAKDGRLIGFMPSHHYAHYSDADLAALIAYLKSIPAIDNDLGPRQIQFPGTIFLGALGYSQMSVNLIDHANIGRNGAPPMEATAAYGEYLINVASCNSCHAENLAGNTDPNGPPLGPNITPGGNLGDWTAEEFATVLRSGQKPDGRQLTPEMPWAQYAAMTDVEIQALWAYLQSLEPLPDNQ